MSFQLASFSSHRGGGVLVVVALFLSLARFAAAAAVGDGSALSGDPLGVDDISPLPPLDGQGESEETEVSQLCRWDNECMFTCSSISSVSKPPSHNVKQ